MILSVIVPVYNVEVYLGDCLDSLVNQTLKDFEIILVNDGSPDNAQHIIDDYKTRYPQLVKSFLKENGGLGSARNYGLQFATGKYIGFLDSDDYAAPVMFEKMVEKAEAEKADIVICEFFMVDEKGNTLRQTEICGHPDLDPEDKKYAHQYGRTEAWNKIYRRELFMNTGIRYPAGWFEDYPTTPLLVEEARRITYVPEPLMYYVVRPGSIMGQASVFSEKNFDILKGTRIIIENKTRFSPETFTFYINHIAPVYAFIRFYKDILLMPSNRKRTIFLKQWAHQLNIILPGWHKSPAILNLRRKISSFPVRLAFGFILWSFSSELFLFLNIVLFILNSKCHAILNRKK